MCFFVPLSNSGLKSFCFFFDVLLALHFLFSKLPQMLFCYVDGMGLCRLLEISLSCTSAEDSVEPDTTCWSSTPLLLHDREKAAYTKVPLSFWHGSSSSYLQSFLVFVCVSFHLEIFLYNSHSRNGKISRLICFLSACQIYFLSLPGRFPLWLVKS